MFVFTFFLCSEIWSVKSQSILESNSCKLNLMQTLTAKQIAKYHKLRTFFQCWFKSSWFPVLFLIGQFSHDLFYIAFFPNYRWLNVFPLSSFNWHKLFLYFSLLILICLMNQINTYFSFFLIDHFIGELIIFWLFEHFSLFISLMFCKFCIFCDRRTYPHHNKTISFSIFP